MLNKPTTTRVLLVEDSQDDAELVVLELELAGLQVQYRRVDSAGPLRAALLEETWDVVISDYAMPGFNGLEAFQLVESLGIDVPFIFVSGALGEARAVEAMRAGARDYLLKENLTRLAEAVRRELKEVESRRERTRVEEMAQREARRLAMAVGASGAGVFEHRVPPQADSYYSERWAAILGFDLTELPPPAEVQSWFEGRLHPDHKRDVDTARANFLSGHQTHFEIETRVAHKDGSWVWVALFCKPVAREPSGKVTEVVGVMLELTQRRRLEDQLRQAQKMEAIGRLAGGVAHDFNNLLTVIYTFGGFVLEGLDEGSSAAGDMQEVLRAAHRAAGLTGQLLAFSRRQTIEPRILNLNDLVSGVEKMLRRLLGEDIDFRLALSSRLDNVRVDPSAFEQVLVNLAINARDAMPGGGKLTIETRTTDFALAYSDPLQGGEIPAGRYVEVSVSDEGTGIDPEILTHIFEPFFTTKEPGKGTGLGLSTCYGIIKQASGHILVNSKVGGGTAFRVLLPHLNDGTEMSEAPSKPTTLLGTETILLAEDDEQVRRLSVRVLTRHGYQVIEAQDGAAALRIAAERQEPIHLLLTDVVMPAMSGKQLVDALLALRPQVKVLYMSGYTANAMAQHDVLGAETTLLQKPFTPEHLARSVRNVLDRE